MACGNFNKRTHEQFKHFRTRTEQVKEYLDKLEAFKLGSPNEIHSQFLKELAEEGSEPLVIIFESSWKTGDILQD